MINSTAKGQLTSARPFLARGRLLRAQPPEARRRGWYRLAGRRHHWQAAGGLNRDL